ncbi:MAG: alpha/beta fold hydrolase [Actinobacteria bacterium]|nr:alpha/beta fold hydrolase [Actinomycetota bacterium]
MPEIQYARTEDGTHVAYQADEAGGVDLLQLSTFLNSIAAPFEHPSVLGWNRRLASFCRVIRYDRRGIGLSDPVDIAQPLTIEHWMQDALAVLDTLEVGRAALLAVEQVSGLTAALLAATFPERVRALVLMNTSARLCLAPDYPIGLPPEAQTRLEARIEERWPDALPLEALAPGVADDEEIRRAWRESLVLGGRPATAVAVTRVIFQSDVRSVLSAIGVPTLVLHCRDNRMVPIEHGRFLAEHIAGAEFVELDSADHLYFGDAGMDEIEQFLTGTRKGPAANRALATVLFTDIAGSTSTAARMGDRRWRELLDAHDAMVRRQLERFQGRYVKQTGDGVLATFDGPARGIECAAAIRNGAHQLGIEVRAGLHTGEIELRDADIGGIAVHIAARVLALAAPGEVLVSRTVTDLVVGSGIAFLDRGEQQLKGVPQPWRVLSVAG